MFYIGRQWFLNIEINPQMYKLIAEEIEDFFSNVQPQDAPHIIPAELISYSDVVPIMKFVEQQLSQPLRSDHIHLLSNLKIILENKYSLKSGDNSYQASPIKNQSGNNKLG